MPHSKRMTWEDFNNKMDWEGPEYMFDLDPKEVPKELEEAQSKLVSAYEEWKSIVERNWPLEEDWD